MDHSRKFPQGKTSIFLFLRFSYGFPMVFPSYRWVPFPHRSPRRLRPRAFRHVRCRRGVRRGHADVQVAQIGIVHLVERVESSRPIRRPMNSDWLVVTTYTNHQVTPCSGSSSFWHGRALCDLYRWGLHPGPRGCYEYFIDYIHYIWLYALYNIYWVNPLRCFFLVAWLCFCLYDVGPSLTMAKLGAT